MIHTVMPDIPFTPYTPINSVITCEITMETESLSVYQLGTDKSVLVKRVSDELCVIVANTKEMQKYIQFTPNRSVLL